MRAAAGHASAYAIAEQTGFNHETIRRYLNGRGISAEFVAVFCQTYKVRADWVLFGNSRTSPRRSAM